MVRLLLIPVPSLSSRYGEGNGSSGRTFHFDNVWTGHPDFDVIAPDAPQNIGAVPANYYNLVTWADVGGESDELYHVYCSPEPISDINDGVVELVASNVLEGLKPQFIISMHH
ncbi:hypothetical protein Ct9H90mP12_2310 [bacterium]|nr:MAG: hypothetical protein Ct9H90mP12_2310 [bacterium]